MNPRKDSSSAKAKDDKTPAKNSAKTLAKTASKTLAETFAKIFSGAKSRLAKLRRAISLWFVVGIAAVIMGIGGIVLGGMSLNETGKLALSTAEIQATQDWFGEELNAIKAELTEIKTQQAELAARNTPELNLDEIETALGQVRDTITALDDKFEQRFKDLQSRQTITSTPNSEQRENPLAPAHDPAHDPDASWWQRLLNTFTITRLKGGSE